MKASILFTRRNIAFGLAASSFLISDRAVSAAGIAAIKTLVVDMSKLTCRELTKVGFQDFAGLTMWLSGYYNASVRSTVIDLNEFAQAAETVKDFCQTSPQSTVMTAAERALGIKMPRPR
jgi:acid stress chaperone HdeB